MRRSRVTAAALSLSIALGCSRSIERPAPLGERPASSLGRPRPVLDASPRHAGASTTTVVLPSLPGLAPIPGGAHLLTIGGSRIQVSLEPGRFVGREAAVLGWIERCARAVAGYYGAFPVPNLSIEVRSSNGSGIRGGQTFPGSPPRITIRVGAHASAAAFERNWSMTHEMVHLAFPNVPSAQHWIEEGLATYVEPIARARAGWITEEAVWAEWLENMPLGLPKAGDGGLDGTDDWGRTYWGGALFCLVAAVALLERTGGRQGLDDALRAIVAAGGNISARWPLVQALQAGDAATGGSGLLDTYASMKDAPVQVDLEALWRKLGVVREAGRVRFDDAAPLASVRRAIVAGKR